MRIPSRIPEHLAESPFRTRDASDAGVTARRLRNDDLARPHAGLHTNAEPAVDLEARAREYAPLLHGHQFFSHTTSAQLWGIPLPPRLRDDALHVATRWARREPRRPGVVGHRIDLPDGQLHIFSDSIALCSPAETWAQLGDMLDVGDLVAAGDYIVGRGALAQPAALLAAADRIRRRGIERLRAASELIDARSESPQESRLRVAIHYAGLPRPEVNWDLRASGGRLVARLDLAYPRYRTGCEYDGRQHAEDPRQFARDAERWDDIADQGWRLVRVLSGDLADGSGVHRLRRTLIRAGWSP